jgi:hypothetical protein
MALHTGTFTWSIRNTSAGKFMEVSENPNTGNLSSGKVGKKYEGFGKSEFKI